MRKAMSPVVATALLLVVAVLAVIGFQNWFGSYSSEMFVKTEKSSSKTSQTNIETLIGNQLYFKNSFNENVSIKQIKLGNRECNISLNVSSGVHNISLGTCTDNLTLSDSIGDIVVITENQIYTKKHLFKDVTIVSSSLGSSCSNPVICFINPTPENNLVSTDVNYLINVSINLEDIYNVTFDWNGSKQNLSVINTFYKTVTGGFNDDRIYAIKQMMSEDYVTTGYTTSFGDGNYITLITKWDKLGNEVWSKYIGSGASHLSYDLEIINEEIYLLSFSRVYGDSDNDLVLSKFDSDGNHIWSKILNTGSDDFGYKMIYRNNSIYVTYDSMSHCGSDKDITITKFNLSGNEEWTSCLNGAAEDRPFDIEVDSQGNIIVSGYTKSYDNSDNDIILIKLNSSGSEQWSYYFSGSGLYDAGNGVTTHGTDIYLFSGTYSYGGGEGDLMLSKFTSDGSEQWSKIFDRSEENYAEEIITVSDGLIMNAYYAGYGEASKTDTVIIKTDFDGILQWVSVLPDDSYSTDLIQTFDGGIATAQNSNARFGTTSQDFAIVKYDSEGKVETFSEMLYPTESFGSDIGVTPVAILWSETSIDLTESEQSITISDAILVPATVYENLSDIKGIYPNQYFQINKSGLSLGNYNYSAEVCNATTCFEENRSLTIN